MSWANFISRVIYALYGWGVRHKVCIICTKKLFKWHVAISWGRTGSMLIFSTIQKKESEGKSDRENVLAW